MRTAPAVMTGGEALVAALAAHGVDTVFGIPGTHNLSVYAAMPGHEIRHVLTRHEQGAGYAADGYARSSGRPGVVVTTTGPAILNAAAAAAQAYSDSIPVLFVSPGMPLQHPALGNGLLHEIRDQSAAMAAVVGNSHRVTSVREIPLAVAQSFAQMTAGRPRPVHMEIPLDLLDASDEVLVVPPVVPAIAVPAEDALDAAGAALEAAENPLLIVGGGAAGAVDQVAALADACIHALTVTRDPNWARHVLRCWAWFTGDNDAGSPLVDLRTGAVHDVLTPTGPSDRAGLAACVAALGTHMRASK